MCGRTSLFADVDTIADRFDLDIDIALPPRYNVAPDDWLATVTTEAPRTVSRLEWGLVPHWADAPDAGPRPINARRETVDEAAPFRDAYRSRRCLVLVDGYYEWGETPHGSQPYRFERRDRGPFALAGVWDRWENEGATLDSVAILTADAVPAVEDIHDRMPVILRPDSAHEWLDAPPADPADATLDPVWDDAFHRYPVGTRVNDPSNDDPSVIEPADGGSDQPTLSDF